MCLLTVSQADYFCHIPIHNDSQPPPSRTTPYQLSSTTLQNRRPRTVGNMTRINQFSDKTSLYRILLLTVCLLANPLLGGIALNLHFQSRRHTRRGQLRSAFSLAKRSVAMAVSGVVMSFFILLLVGLYVGGGGDQQGPQIKTPLDPAAGRRPEMTSNPNRNLHPNSDTNSHHPRKGPCYNHRGREQITINAPIVQGGGHVGGGGGGHGNGKERNDSSQANLD
ncbi:uncharacterized protein LOC115225290 [Octopus sinensis]|uniref:Uncharacterized protein LOC115225290 n=1 Tax=Octopus sinensis TaxID=2607531 RepID=A0A6P7TRW3_9MOLL|nr:uncharacterized protein LOC115225290 [Octopus sinensis]